MNWLVTITSLVPVESEAALENLPEATPPVIESWVQVTPASAEIATSPPEVTATSFVPVESEATLLQLSDEAEALSIQVAPELVEVQISPAVPVPVTPAETTATRLVPVASDATLVHVWPDAALPFVRLVQLTPELVDVQISPF